MSTYTDKESYEEKKEVQKTTYNKIGVLEILTKKKKTLNTDNYSTYVFYVPIITYLPTCIHS